LNAISIGFRRAFGWGRVLAVPLVALFLIPGGLRAQERVTLQLKWEHAFQFAGYYAAQDKGYYRDAGLDVRIDEAIPGLDVVDAVLMGAAQYGVGTSGLVLTRAAGKPVVALAVIFQHSPLAIASVGDGALQSVHSLAGKRVMIEEQAEDLMAYLEQEGVDPASLTVLPHSFDINDLIAGRVDAASVYVTYEPYFLRKAGVPYQIYSPRAVGIDFYGDNLFTTEAEIADHPERAQAFREASLKGWDYALRHPEEAIDMVMARVGGRHERAFYAFEARHTAPMIRADLIEVGYMNPGRWRAIADIYADSGLIPADFSLKGFLYTLPGAADWWRFAPYIYGTAAAATLFGLTALYVIRVNRRLTANMRCLAEASRDLAASEERHRLLADHATDVIWTMTLDGRFTYVSPSVEKLRGFTVAEVMAQSLEQALCPGSVEKAQAGIVAAISAVHEGRPIPPYREELEQPRKDGSTVWTEATVDAIRNARGEFVGLLGVSRDITERRELEERLRRMAQHDPLTGLPNRALFSDRLGQALAVARREGTRLAVGFIDLDGFKPINDEHGHEVGDAVLVAVASRIGGALRQSDTVARIGGDEFVMLLTHVPEPMSALTVAEKVLADIRGPIHLGDLTVNISASIGLAVYPDDGDCGLSLARSADQAMYRVKREGRNGCRLHGPDDRECP
jgi:diguanylate cyclase (GGDEF)-like protein/PAS domain S-box-containing protein